MRDAELVDQSVEGIGDAARMPLDTKKSLIERDRGGLARLRDARAVQIEELVAGACVLIVGADDVAPAAVPQRARDVVLQSAVGPVEIPGEAPL
jgi:hypothetical protein